MSKIFTVVLIGALSLLTAGAALAQDEGMTAGAPASGAVFQQGQMSLNIWGGYTTLAMSKLNTALQDLSDLLEASYWGDGNSLKKVSGGIDAGLGLDFEVIPGLKIGPRVGFLYAFPGEVKGQWDYVYWTGSAYADGTDVWTSTFDASLIPITAGISYSPQAVGNIGFTFGLNVGLGLAYGQWTSKYTTDDPAFDTSSFRYEIPIAGSGLYANVVAAMNYFVGDNSNLFLRLGYRLASFTDLTVTKTVRNSALGRVDEGDIAEDYQGDPLVLDFSGLDIGVGFCFGF